MLFAKKFFVARKGFLFPAMSFHLFSFFGTQKSHDIYTY
jgi:hypothetical protein